MFTTKLSIIMVYVIMLMALLLNACGPQSTPVQQLPSPLPPTSMPPSPIPSTPTPTLAPTPTLEPEIQADNAAAILGTWSLGTKLSAGMTLDYLIFSSDGSYSWEVGKPFSNRFKKGQKLGEGKYWFEGNQLRIESARGCFDRDLNGFPCVGVYEAYVRMQAGTPVMLRLVKVEDEYYARNLSFPGLHSLVNES